LLCTCILLKSLSSASSTISCMSVLSAHKRFKLLIWRNQTCKYCLMRWRTPTRLVQHTAVYWWWLNHKLFVMQSGSFHERAGLATCTLLEHSLTMLWMWSQTESLLASVTPSILRELTWLIPRTTGGELNWHVRCLSVNSISTDLVVLSARLLSLAHASMLNSSAVMESTFWAGIMTYHLRITKCCQESLQPDQKLWRRVTLVQWLIPVLYWLISREDQLTSCVVIPT